MPAFIPTPEALCSSDIKQSATLVNRLFKPFEGLTLRRFGALILLIISIQDLAHASPQSRLSSDFVAAMQFDPEFQSAIAQRDAGLEAQEQAKASLRPQVFFNLQRSINDTYSRPTTSLGPLDRNFENYPSLNASVQVRQALYRPKLWATLDQSKFQALYAELSLLGAQQDLGMRLMSSHVQWASAELSRQLAAKGLQIHEQLLNHVQRQVSAGESTRVDLELASARVAQAKSQVTEAASAAAIARFSLLQITGSTAAQSSAAREFNPISPIELPRDLITKLPLAFESLHDWQKAAEVENPVVRAQAFAVSAAAQEAKKASADHLPTVDAFASKSQASSAMDNTVGTQFRSAAIGVQLNVPIYSGGAVNSQIRQSLALLRRAEQDLLATKARIAIEVEREWHNLEAAKSMAASQLAQLQALSLSLHAIKRGQTAGIATRADEEQLRLQMLAAERELAFTHTKALNAWARLMACVGKLSASALEQLQETALIH